MEKTPTPIEQLRRVDSTKGPIIATIIIIIVLILGAIVVFYNQYQESRKWQENYYNDNASTTSPTSLPTNKEAAPISSTSTNIADIESDLEVADMSDLETEIEALSTEVE